MRTKHTFDFASLVIAIGLCACVSTRPLKKPVLSLSLFDAIKLHDSATEVLRQLGNPSEQMTSRSKPGSEVLIYNDESSQNEQLAAVEINRLNKTVSGVIIIPRESDRENSLEYLLNNKFSGVAFEKFKRARCGVDYDRNQTVYLNVPQGIVIEQETNSESVSSFSKASQAFPKLLQKRRSHSSVLSRFVKSEILPCSKSRQ